ncbi:hypothetical protein [Citrobacter phage Tr1]|nr:hypothetical protein [Citrobacter phage Tr1]
MSATTRVVISEEKHLDRCELNCTRRLTSSSIQRECGRCGAPDTMALKHLSQLYRKSGH